MNELLIQVTFYLNAFQMLEEVPNEWVVYDGLHDSMEFQPYSNVLMPSRAFKSAIVRQEHEKES